MAAVIQSKNYFDMEQSLAKQIHAAIQHLDPDWSKQVRAKTGCMFTEGFRKLHDMAKSPVTSVARFGHSYWSKGALRILAANGGKCTKAVKDAVSVEHVIPLMYIVNEMLFNLPKDTPIDTILHYMRTYSFVAIVTREEAALLKKKGFESKMPSGWDRSNLSSENIFARYVEIGLYDQIELME